jgi:hypothetical protein
MRRIGFLIVASIGMTAMSSCCFTGFASGNQDYSINWGNIGTGQQVISPVEREPWQGDALEQAMGGH